MNILEYILAFAIFCIMQSFAINGLYYAFKIEFIKNGEQLEIKENILAPIARWISRKKHPFFLFIRKPIYECVRCMASFWGAVTFFPVALAVFGFEWWQLGVYVFDVLVLVTLNWWIYKRL